MGKTAMSITLAAQIASTGSPVMFVTLEMSRWAVCSRAIAAHCCYPLRDLMKSGHTEDEVAKLQNWTQGFLEYPIRFVYPPVLAVEELDGYIRRMMPRPAVIVIDYLQLLTTKRAAEKNLMMVHQIGIITAELKRIARQYDCCVIALSQLNRGVDSRQDKVPLLSDLRDSGNIEQDADVVLLLYRGSYYTKDLKGDVDTLEMFVAKNRNGQLGKLEFDYNLTTQRIGAR